MSNTSETNWEKVDALTEQEIDTSDIPPLTEDFFENSRWWRPKGKRKILVEVDLSTLSWFQSQGDNYEQRMAAALRIYADAHKAEISTSESAIL